MKQVRILLAIVCLLSVMCGCQDEFMQEKSGQGQNDDVSYITVNDTDISVEQINKEIQEKFNDYLYYHGHVSDSEYITSNADLVSGKTLEYELYYTPNINNSNYLNVSDETMADNYASSVQIVITSLEHPLSTNEQPLYYYFGMQITKNGLKYGFHLQGSVEKKEHYQFYYDNAGITQYLGKYSMRLNEISEPKHMTISQEWKDKAKKEICGFMDSNNYSIDESKNLLAGAYRVYIPEYFENDTDGSIVFEHENGSVYTATLYFIQQMNGEGPLSLNHLQLVDAENMYYAPYLEKAKKHAVLSMEYTVKEQ